MKRVGVLFNPNLAKAAALAKELESFLKSQAVTPWLSSAWEIELLRKQVPGSDLILSIGGDGTILRAARASAPWAIPVVGINLGNLGFMTELRQEEVAGKLPQLLAGEGWVDARAMLQTELLVKKEGQVYHALNDVFLGRGRSVRLVSLEAKIDSQFLGTYRADGVIIATATGSSSYSLAAGGPIMYPQSKDMLLQPVSPHLTMRQALVLPADSVIELKVCSFSEAMLSLDGQVEMPLAKGEGVTVRSSPYKAHFLRLRSRSEYFTTLEEKLKGRIYECRQS